MTFCCASTCTLLSGATLIALGGCLGSLNVLFFLRLLSCLFFLLLQLLLVSQLCCLFLRRDTGCLSCSVRGKLGQTSLLLLSKLIFCFLLSVPVLNVGQHLLFVDVGDTVVLSELRRVEALTTARLASNRDLEGL